MSVRAKSKEWLIRYLPSEVVGTLTAMVAAAIANTVSDNLVLIAYAGAVSESIGFYATVIIQRIIAIKRKHDCKGKSFTVITVVKIMIGVVFEFGPAGLIDGLFLRPFLMYIFPLLLNNVLLGVFVGKIVGDITFYFLVILGYELSKSRRKTLHERHTVIIK